MKKVFFILIFTLSFTTLFAQHNSRIAIEENNTTLKNVNVLESMLNVTNISAYQNDVSIGNEVVGSEMLSNGNVIYASNIVSADGSAVYHIAYTGIDANGNVLFSNYVTAPASCILKLTDYKNGYLCGTMHYTANGLNYNFVMRINTTTGASMWRKVIEMQIPSGVNYTQMYDPKIAIYSTNVYVITAYQQSGGTGTSGVMKYELNPSTGAFTGSNYLASGVIIDSKGIIQATPLSSGHIAVAANLEDIVIFPVSAAPTNKINILPPFSFVEIYDIVSSGTTLYVVLNYTDGSLPTNIWKIAALSLNTSGNYSSTLWVKHFGTNFKELSSLSILPDGNIGLTGIDEVSGTRNPVYFNINASNGSLVWGKKVNSSIIYIDRIHRKNSLLGKTGINTYKMMYSSNAIPNSSYFDAAFKFETNTTSTLSSCNEISFNPTITTGSITGISNQAVTSAPTATLSVNTSNSPGITSLSAMNTVATTVCSSVSAPVADFSANITTPNIGQTVTFTDLSTNTPTAWTWSSSPSANVSWSNVNAQNPTATFGAVGCYTITLTCSNSGGSNSVTKNCYINIASTPVNIACDTIRSVFGLMGNPTVYTNTGAGNWGYAGGTNSYGDINKANLFSSSTYVAGKKLIGAFMKFSNAHDAGPANNTTIKVWNSTGAGGSPGTVIASANASLSSIVSTVNSNSFAYIAFASPISVSGNYYLGFSVPATPDTIAIFTNTNGQTNPGTAWEEWSSGGGWHAFTDATNSWGLNVSLLIYPVMCTTSAVGVEESEISLKSSFFPNPTSGELHYLINNPQNELIKIELYNVLGELVKTERTNQNQGNLDCSAFESGLYTIKISSSTGSTSERIILSK